jgi:hypothetical protein
VGGWVDELEMKRNWMRERERERREYRIFGERRNTSG